MGKHQVSETTPIANKAMKNTTYCKRKRGLIKKCMELSMLCDQQISVVVFDSTKNKIVSYCSNGFEHHAAADLVKLHMETKNKKFESYTNKDYDNLVGIQTINRKNTFSTLVDDSEICSNYELPISTLPDNKRMTYNNSLYGTVQPIHS